MRFTEKNALKQMAEALDEDKDDLDIEESSLESFGEGEAFQVSLGRYTEYAVVPDEETAHDIAIAVVTQDLEHEPEIFEPSFIEGHIDMDALKKWVLEAAYDLDYAQELADRDAEEFWEECGRWDLEVPEPEEDEDGDDVWPDPGDQDVDDLATAMAKDHAEDPMGWLEGMYSPDEARKFAIDQVGIDVESAAQEAVQVDGWAHFLARYDGNYDTTDSGFVYFRTN